ncbi:hypothetical protein CFP56_042616 [Quercus suber]|uniref:Uncharacterized protein n=1 Tax=Quercus suber TaxID=58331 RepID=A0AAW0IU74_QUESU
MAGPEIQSAKQTIACKDNSDYNPLAIGVALYQFFNKGVPKGGKGKKKRSSSTHRSGLASILLKKSPAIGCKELISLFTTTSVSTSKYCVYDKILNIPLQPFAGCCSNPSARIERQRSFYMK